MSFDLCFWKAPVPEDDASGYRMYCALSDGDWRTAQPAPEVVAFRQALISRHTDWEDSVMEPAPGRDGADRYLILNLPFDVPEADVEEVTTLALSGGLVMFDPQQYDGDDDWSADVEALSERSTQVLDASRDGWFIGILEKHGRHVEGPDREG